MSELRGYEQRAPSPRNEFTKSFRWSVWLQYSFVKEPTIYALALNEQDALGLMSRFVEKILNDGAEYNQDIEAKKDGRWSWVVSNLTSGKTVRVWVQEDIAEEGERASWNTNTASRMILNS